MVIVVSAVVITGLLLLTGVAVQVTRRILRWARNSPRVDIGSPSQGYPFGELRTPADPVGPLGSMAPDASLSGDLTQPSDLYGE